MASWHERRSTCRSCRAPIIWVRTERSRMPLDATPADESVHAGFVLRDMGSPEGPLAISATRAMLPGETIYTSHFATCPNAAEHRSAA